MLLLIGCLWRRGRGIRGLGWRGVRMFCIRLLIIGLVIIIRVGVRLIVTGIRRFFAGRRIGFLLLCFGWCSAGRIMRTGCLLYTGNLVKNWRSLLVLQVQHNCSEEQLQVKPIHGLLPVSVLSMPMDFQLILLVVIWRVEPISVYIPLANLYWIYTPMPQQ